MGVRRFGALRQTSAGVANGRQRRRPGHRRRVRKQARPRAARWTLARGVTGELPCEEGAWRGVAPPVCRGRDGSPASGRADEEYDPASARPPAAPPAPGRPASAEAGCRRPPSPAPAGSTKRNREAGDSPTGLPQRAPPEDGVSEHPVPGQLHRGEQARPQGSRRAPAPLRHRTEPPCGAGASRSGRPTAASPGSSHRAPPPPGTARR